MKLKKTKIGLRIRVFMPQLKVLLSSFMVLFGLCTMGERVDAAQAIRMDGLQDSLQMWVTRQDSLLSQRDVLQTSVDSLSSEMERLKRTHSGGTASGALALALRKSLDITLELEVIYQEEIIAGQRIERIKSSLLEACEEELDRLIVLSRDAPDASILAQIQTFRKLRGSLEGAPVQKPLPTVTIEADDTPDDIRLKSELMADVAHQVMGEKAAVDRKLRRLVDERRLRGRARSFASEFSLFDDASPQGRSLSPQPLLESSASPSQEAGDPGFDFAGLVGPPLAQEDSKIESSLPQERGETGLDREVTLEGLTGPDGSPLDELAAEIERLRLRQQELVH
jgi:hypothetical protein